VAAQSFAHRATYPVAPPWMPRLSSSASITASFTIKAPIAPHGARVSYLRPGCSRPLPPALLRGRRALPADHKTPAATYLRRAL